MTTQLHRTGEEFAVKKVFRTDELGSVTTVSVGLYDDSTDGLSDTSGPSDISTEPTGGSYTRQTADLDTSDFTTEENSNNNWQAVIADQTFDVSDSDANVDAYFAIVTFQSESEGDGSQNDNLFWTGDLDQLYDLQYVDEFVLQGSGLEFT
jgi:hypothetical protein